MEAGPRAPYLFCMHHPDSSVAALENAEEQLEHNKVTSTLFTKQSLIEPRESKVPKYRVCRID